MSLLSPGLEAFLAVTEHSTVHGAAEGIGLTQTGVTQRIRTLEERIGTTLFTRSRRGMRLTPEGEALLRYVQGARDLEGEFHSFLEGDDEARAVRLEITGPSSIMRSRILPGVTKVLAAHPRLALTFHLDDDASGLSRLKAGHSQLAILERHEVVDELDSKLLRPARYVLVGPRKWKDRDVRDIVATERIVDFNEHDDATFRYLDKHRLRRRARLERHLANNTDALAALVVAGHGYSVLSTDFAAPLLKRKALVELHPGKRLEIEFALAWYPRPAMPEYFAALVRSIS